MEIGQAPRAGSPYAKIDVSAFAAQLRAARPTRLADVADQDQLPARVLARLPEAEQTAQVNANRVHAAQQEPQTRAVLAALMRRAQEPCIGPKERLRRLRRLVDAWAATVRPHAACRNGCSHCCHSGVTISRTEAELIAQETGRRLRETNSPVEELAALQATAATVHDLAQSPRPCTFLSRDGRCTIYSSRPLACRTLHSLDADALLCELVPGTAIPVPYADASQLTALAALASPDLDLADIRDWFGERQP